MSLRGGVVLPVDPDASVGNHFASKETWTKGAASRMLMPPEHDEFRNR
jgi:hypothetical protein